MYEEDGEAAQIRLEEIGDLCEHVRVIDQGRIVDVQEVAELTQR